MQSFAVAALSTSGFRLTLDLSAWGQSGVALGGAILRCQAFALGAATPALEFVTGGGNPVTFDPATGLAVFAAPATALSGLAGVYALYARAEFSGYEQPLFSGSLTVRPGATTGNPSAGLPSFDTAFIAAHPFGPAPVPAPIAASVASAQSAAAAALVRSFLYGA